MYFKEDTRKNTLHRFPVCFLTYTQLTIKLKNLNRPYMERRKDEWFPRLLPPKKAVLVLPQILK
jgi:hypothetical protein